MIVCLDTNTVVQALAELAEAGYKPQPLSPQQFIMQVMVGGG
jgi:hypothetical protein